MSAQLPRIELSPGLIEERIHEVAALNRLCHALGEVGKQLRPHTSAPIEGGETPPRQPNHSELTDPR